MIKQTFLACLLCIVFVVIDFSGCTSKPNTDPMALFNSLSARANRVAVLYAPAALDAIPLLAAQLKWSTATAEKYKGVIVKIRDASGSVSKTLGAIADTAITADQKIVIGPLLVAIGDGLTELDNLGLFAAIEKSTAVDVAIKVGALSLKTVGRLLPLFTAPGVTHEADDRDRTIERQGRGCDIRFALAFATDQTVWASSCRPRVAA